ncbi:MAG: 7-cyano-7-deazaguanine synthase [Nitrospira bacterium SG8_35_1]|nr:MAG: 7-cyano-7-deazaguanine synthase [Nitrospira bacterium SG8_35_1]
MKKAVVLLSGGLDSSTMLAYAREKGYEVYALSFNYGQRHRIELESAQRVAASFNVAKHLVIDINLREIGGSALTAEIDVPKDRTQLREDTDLSEIPVTYVPARNAIFLSFALAWAETLEAADIFIGANAIDYSGYPDCRPEFIQAFENMANLATKISVDGTLKFTVHTPLMNLTKAEIIKKGTALNVDYSLTWSCYDPQFLNNRYAACMKCDSCLLRAKGFKEAGVEDPSFRRPGE